MRKRYILVLRLYTILVLGVFNKTHFIIRINLLNIFYSTFNNNNLSELVNDMRTNLQNGQDLYALSKRFEQPAILGEHMVFDMDQCPSDVQVAMHRFHPDIKVSAEIESTTRRLDRKEISLLLAGLRD